MWIRLRPVKLKEKNKGYRIGRLETGPVPENMALSRAGTIPSYESPAERQHCCGNKKCMACPHYASKEKA